MFTPSGKHLGAILEKKEEVVPARCRIGHSRLTHSYLLNREEQAECVFCQEYFTFKHVLIDCKDLALARQLCFIVDSMHKLFNNVPYHTILSYLKAIHLYNKI